MSSWPRIHESDNDPIKRVVLFLYEWPGDSKQGQSPAAKVRLDRLHADSHIIQGQVDEILERLESVTDHRFPRVQLNVDHFPSDIDTEDIVKIRAEKGERVRAFVDIRTSVQGNGKGKGMESHLVEIIPRENNEGWHTASGCATASVKLPIERVISLLVDVALDIAMFHSWPYLVDNYDEPVKQRKFSKSKVAYARKKNLTSFYGNILTGEVGYFSFASAIRKGKSFSVEDCKEYEKLWTDFLYSEVVGSTVSASELTNSKKNPVEDLLRRHSMKGELSKSRLAKEISGLKTGDYLLVVTNKKPVEIRYRVTLMRLLGRTQKRPPWKRRAWVIVPYSKRVMYLRHWPHYVFLGFRI